MGVSELRRWPQLQLNTKGASAALSALRVCALASQHLNRTNGFLPGFGCFAFRVEQYQAPPEAKSCTLQTMVGRLLPPDRDQHQKHELTEAKETDSGEADSAPVF